MGNAASSKELSEKKLIIKNRFLQKQIQNNTEIDPATKHAILNVKKTRTYTNLVFSGGSTKGLSYVGVLDYLDKNRFLSRFMLRSTKHLGFLDDVSVFLVFYYTNYLEI